ncbi:Cof-type HAD-IIB family hydrolase [Bacillus suaedae]|uniref:Cof-type HAD-IIB family hydrolase n=1 Tax=Halalkalibacter suaedae TaxID=2822140 RepID=UPI001FF0CCFD|nr:Cof-type HAD-IIB family hydrolase [Bacillus suaedae]
MTNINHENIQLIAIDMDGTLLDHEHKISIENRKAIKAAQDKGIHVVISTGRTRMTLDDLIESLSLDSYLITVNGSEIWDASRQLVDRQILSTDLVEYMWELKQKHQTECWAASVGNVWRETFPEDFTSHEWMKFGFNIEDDQLRQIILEELSENQLLEVTNSSLTNLEVNAGGVNKARAIEKVCGLLGLTMNQVMALGDSLNDLAMIKEAGIGVAMGNAQPIVKEAADWVTVTNEESGVAEAIKKWCL